MAIQFSSAQSRGLATLIEAGAERQVYNSFVMLADVFDVVRFEFDFTDRAVPLNNVDSSDPPLNAGLPVAALAASGRQVRMGTLQKESRPCVFSCFYILCGRSLAGRHVVLKKSVQQSDVAGCAVSSAKDH
jgi:hypothetical protein